MSDLERGIQVALTYLRIFYPSGKISADDALDKMAVSMRTAFRHPGDSRGPPLTAAPRPEGFPDWPKAIERAKSDPLYARALRLEIAYLIGKGDHLAPPLREYAAGLLRKGGIESASLTHPNVMFHRNVAICFTVLEVAAQAGLEKTTNREPSSDDRNPSACLAVSLALRRMGKDLSERSIEKIWADRERHSA